MTKTFASLKKSSSAQFEKLNNHLSSMNKTYTNDKDDYWKIEVDKAGNGYAIIRFLPAPPEEDNPFVRVWDHAFQGPGGWYIEKSLTTIGKDDPLGEYNQKLWNSGVDENKEIVRKQKRHLGFHANIYVVKDPTNPENEGKVFKFQFGKRIFDMINDAMNPSYEDESPLNPFDFWEGANFKLKASKRDGYRNYDKSEFDKPGKMTDPSGKELTDEQMEEIWNSQHSLAELIDPKGFKTYEQLSARLAKVLGHSVTKNDEPQQAADPEPENPFNMEDAAQEYKDTDSSSSDDDDLAFFEGLAND